MARRTIELNVPSASVPVLPQPAGLRSGHLNLDTFSPVNQDGSFAFDRVLKSGKVHKRTRKTKQWKPFYLVLRPNLLSLYKSPTEERLLKQITLSDLSAVAYLKDPKGRRENLFGLYSPSRNWHLQADSAAEAKSWVELVRQEARIDEEEQELPFASSSKLKLPLRGGEPDKTENDPLGSSSPESSILQSGTTRDGIRIPGIRRRSAPSLEYSGDEQGPYSDFSDTPPSSLARQSSLGAFMSLKQKQPVKHQQTPYAAPLSQLQPQPLAPRNASAASGHYTEPQAPEPQAPEPQAPEPQAPEPQADDRVVWHGYLLYLKSKGAVRQWKRTWVVLRTKNLALYKNEEEYAANLIIPLSNIVDAVEIDPISKTKQHCMQVISEHRSFRFCASSEDTLAEWLGALKSQLAKRKEKEKENPRR